MYQSVDAKLHITNLKYELCSQTCLETKLDETFSGSKSWGSAEDTEPKLGVGITGRRDRRNSASSRIRSSLSLSAWLKLPLGTSALVHVTEVRTFSLVPWPDWILGATDCWINEG